MSINAAIANIKNIKAYKLILAIYILLDLSFCTASKAVSIFDKNILKIGKITPLARETTIPKINVGIFPLE